MYIYSGTGKTLIGPITERENNENLNWGTCYLDGDSIIIEIKLLSNDKDSINLHLNNVGYAFTEKVFWV